MHAAPGKIRSMGDAQIINMHAVTTEEYHSYQHYIPKLWKMLSSGMLYRVVWLYGATFQTTAIFIPATVPEISLLHKLYATVPKEELQTTAVNT